MHVDEQLIDYINKIVRRPGSGRSFTWALRRGPGSRSCRAPGRWPLSTAATTPCPTTWSQIALPALRHRVILTAEAEVEGHKVDDLLADLVRSVEVPRL